MEQKKSVTRSAPAIFPLHYFERKKNQIRNSKISIKFINLVMIYQKKYFYQFQFIQNLALFFGRFEIGVSCHLPAAIGKFLPFFSLIISIINIFFNDWCWIIDNSFWVFLMWFLRIFSPFFYFWGVSTMVSPLLRILEWLFLFLCHFLCFSKCKFLCLCLCVWGNIGIVLRAFVVVAVYFRRFDARLRVDSLAFGVWRHLWAAGDPNAPVLSFLVSNQCH